MRRFLMLTSPVWITVGILALVILRPSAAQDRPVQNPVEVKDLAELFPTRTVAYVETKDIKAAVKEFRAVLKGSFIDDMPASLEKFMGDDQDFYRGYESRILALYFSAESLDEISRLKGGALALVDNPKDFHAMPNFLGVLLTGDSNLVHLSARSLLNFSRMRVVATVEGVKIYREPPYRNDFRDKFDKVKDKPFDFKDKDLDRDEKFQVQAVDDHDMADARHSAPALALMPGAIIIGSQTKEVSDLIRRLKGKNAGPTLASNSEFKKHTNLRKDPGLFAFANLETVATLGRELIFSGSRSNKYRDKRFPDEKDFPKDKDFPFEDFKDKKLEQVSAQGRGGRDERPKDSMTEIFASLAKSFKTIALGLSLSEGTLDLQGTLRMEIDPKSAWPDFFTSRTVNLKMLDYVPLDSRFVLTVALPNDMKFWDKLGKTAPVLETELAALLNLVDIDKITQIALIDRHPPGDNSLRNTFQIIIEAKDEETAKNLAASPLKNNFAMASKGRFAAFGQNRKSLVELLETGESGKGLSSRQPVARAIKGHEGAQALMVWSVGQQMADIPHQKIRWLNEERNRFQDERFKDKFFEDKKKIFDGEVLFQQPGEEGGRDAYLKRLERLGKDFSKAVENLPPLVLSVTRKDNQLLIAGKQANLQGTTARILDLLMETEMTAFGRFYNPRFDDIPKDGFKDKK